MVINGLIIRRVDEKRTRGSGFQKACLSFLLEYVSNKLFAMVNRSERF